MNCDLCWEEVDDFDMDAEFELEDLVVCSKCRSDGEDPFLKNSRILLLG